MFLSTILRGRIAQSVEQRTENPCVAGSIPVLATPPETFSGMIMSPVFSFCNPLFFCRIGDFQIINLCSFFGQLLPSAI